MQIKVQQQRNTLYIALPKTQFEKPGIKKGDTLTIQKWGDGFKISK